jgi:hypothetical protein
LLLSSYRSKHIGLEFLFIAPKKAASKTRARYIHTQHKFPLRRICNSESSAMAASNKFGAGQKPLLEIRIIDVC